MGDGQAMIRKITGFSLLATALLGLFPLACQPGGVGDPCLPEDEYHADFPGYAVGEVNAEAKSFQCETRLCLVNHFQGRVSCKYGQAKPADGALAAADNCKIPGDPKTGISVEVTPQLAARTADQAVYCSCRCDGANKNARYCKCPSGYACQHTIDDIGVGDPELAGSYCIRDGSKYVAALLDSTPCQPKGYPLSQPATGSKASCGTTDGETH